MAKDAKKVEVQPIGDQVLVKRLDMTETKSASGIIIPDTAAKEKSKRGIIVATGAGRTNDDGKVIPMNASIKVGAKVFFNSGWDNEVDIGGDDEEFFLVKESDIRAIIK